MTGALLFGLCAAILGWNFCGLTAANPFGVRGGWLATWRSEPGSTGESFSRLGARLLSGPMARTLGAAFRPVAAFLGCPLDPVVGAAVALAAALAILAIAPPPVAALAIGLAFLGSHQVRVAAQAARRKAWEVEMAALLDQIALQVTGGRSFRSAVDAMGGCEPGLVSAEFLRGLQAAWACGRDSASAIEDQIPGAPDTSSAAFLSQLAQVVRRGGPLLPVLDAEVSRLRQSRKQRLTAALEGLPLRLAVVNACTFGAAIAIIGAFAVALVLGMMPNLKYLGLGI